MTGKLWKWEWRRNSRMLLIATGACVAAGLGGILLGLLKMPLLAVFGFIVVAIAAVVLPYLVTWLLAWRYWKTMYGGQGYFTNTIPVRGRSLFYAKANFAALAGLLTMLISCALLAGGAWSVFYATGTGREGIDQALAHFRENPTLWWFMILLMVFSVVAMTYQVFGGISLGQGKGLVHMGAGGSILVLVILYLVNQVVSLIGTFLIPGGLYLEGPHAGEFTSKTMLQDLIETFRAVAANPDAYDPNAQTQLIGLAFIPLLVIVTVAVVWMATRSIEKHTSLR